MVETASGGGIGHLKSDHRMERCWLAGALGDALHAVRCAVGYKLRWLMRAMARLGLDALVWSLIYPRWLALLCQVQPTIPVLNDLGRRLDLVVAQ
jgi:hypothetical protein